jgi:hypothetical protein
MRAYRFTFGHYWLTGFNFAITRDAYLRSGGFKAELNAQEDVELAYRVKKIGKIKFIQDMPVEVSGRRYQKGLVIGMLPYVTTFLKYFFLKKTDILLSDPR